VSYVRTKRSLITEVHSDAGWTYYAHDARGALLTRHLPNGSRTYYTYDDAGRLSTLRLRCLARQGAQRSVLGGHTTYFEYNSRNLITRIDSTDPAFTTPNTFEYNALGQRVQKVGGGCQIFFRQLFLRPGGVWPGEIVPGTIRRHPRQPLQDAPALEQVYTTLENRIKCA